MADSRFAPSQWKTVLLCNDISHCLDTNLESALKQTRKGFINDLEQIFVDTTQNDRRDPTR